MSVEYTKKTNKAAVASIVFCEFCERFSYYGMRAILPSYLKTRFLFTDKEIVIALHLFVFCCFVFPLFGGILADNCFGRFKTILGFLFVSLVGLLCMFFTSVHAHQHRFLLFCGLSFIAIGSGGIKPCVSPFGGDQINSNNKKSLFQFFSSFYFAINIGSLLASGLIPNLVYQKHCFGLAACYSAGFGVTALLVFLSMVIFLSFSSSYTKRKPSGSVFYDICCVLLCAFKKKKNEKEKQFLFYAIPEHSFLFISKTAKLFSVLSVLSPLAVFWALYEQQISSWYFQGMKMKQEIRIRGNELSVYPEQMQMINPALILLFIPLMIAFVYPFFQRKDPQFFQLSIMQLGVLMPLVAFTSAIILEFAIINQQLGHLRKLCILFQFPQYFFITLGEAFISSPGLDFAYANSPDEMKSLCQAGWFFFIALGNLLTVFVKFFNIEKAVASSYRGLFLFLFYFLIMSFAVVLFYFKTKFWRTKHSEEEVWSA